MDSFSFEYLQARISLQKIQSKSEVWSEQARVPLMW